MNDISDKLKRDGQSVRLLQSEKQAIKDRVLSMPLEEPAKGFGLVFLTFFHSKKLVAMAVFALLLVSGIPLTYATQKSGPGDLLHGFELSIIEPVEHLVYFSTNSQVDYSTRRLEERLDELQEVPEGQITDEQFAIANDNVQEYADEALVAIPDATQKEVVSHIVKVSALLNAHEDVLIDNQQEVEEIEDLNNKVEMELSDQVEEYADQQDTTQLAEIIKQEAAEVSKLIEGSRDAESLAIAEQLRDAQEEALKGNLEGALQEILDAKVQALAQNYTEPTDEELQQ